VGNWNACLQRARGYWVHLLHQDDRLAHGFYGRMRSPCQREGGIGAAFCRGGGIDSDGAVAWVMDPERETSGVLADFAQREASENRILAPCIVVRRAAYEALGGYHTGLAYCADWDMYKRLAAYADIWYEPDCLAYWRQHEDTATARLQESGRDLADRRRSIELSRAYLPQESSEEGSLRAIRHSLILATDVLRDQLRKDKPRAAMAQASEIVQSLSLALGETPHLASRPDDEEKRRLRGELERLEAEVQAWIRAAESLHRRSQRVPGNHSMPGEAP
jgi:hypothetical protein